MKSLMIRVQNLKLFTKIFLVMVISIVCVSWLTLWTTKRASEQLFMSSFSIMNSKVISQVRAGFESFHHAVINAAITVVQSGTVKSFLTEPETDAMSTIQLYYNMKLWMNRAQSNVDMYDVGVTVVGLNGQDYSTNRPHWMISPEVMLEHEMTKQVQQQPERLIYQYVDGDMFGDIEQQPLVVAVRALKDRTFDEPYGYVYISIREVDFRNIYANITREGNDIMLLDREGTIVSSNRTELLGTKSKELLTLSEEIVQQQFNARHVQVLDQDSIVLAEYLPDYDLYIINLIDRETAINEMFNLQTPALMSFLIIMITIFLFFLITKQLTKSLAKLVRQMSNITKHNFQHYIQIGGSYETRELGAAYNYMLDELHDYIDKLMATEQEKRNAELAALQSQINPHFLYNTLASVNMLIHQEDKEKATGTMNALISLLQSTLGDVSETISLEKELMNLKHYVYINHVRYGDKIKVSYFVAPDCLACHVPKLMIQPFVENAFFHAFTRKNEGTIHIMVSRDHSSLVCEIIDNGDGIAGLQSDDVLPLSAGHNKHLFSGIGIKNVHDRITLLYGEDYGVSVISKEGEGTRVKVRLPVILKPKESATT